MAKKNAAQDAADTLKKTIADAGGGSITVGDTMVEIESSEKADTPPEPGKPSAEIIAKVIADTNEEIRRFMPRLRESEADHDEATKAAKDAKKTMEGNHLHLSMLCGRLADAMNGNYQPLLFDAPTKALPLADEGAAMPIGSLRDHGLTDKMVETLVEHEVETVGKLETLMSADAWWHRKIKGFGEDRITKVIDALMSFRSQNPIPSPDDEPLEEQVTDTFRGMGILAE